MKAFESYTVEVQTAQQLTEWFSQGDHVLKGGVQTLDDLLFDSESDATEWLSDHTDNWFGAKAVRAKTSEGQVWVVGGWV